MARRLSLLVGGCTLAALGIAMVVNSGLGAFSVTCANMAIANWLGIRLGLAGMLVDLVMLAIATYLGEGVGWTSIANATYTSFAIDFFIRVVPTGTYMVLGLLLVPIGWSMMGRAGLGDTGCNILMNALLKLTKKSMGFIRGTEETICMILGLLGTTGMVTWFTLILSFGLGYLLQFMYKLLRYEPTDVSHSFIIKYNRH